MPAFESRMTKLKEKYTYLTIHEAPHVEEKISITRMAVASHAPELSSLLEFFITHLAKNLSLDNILHLINPNDSSKVNSETLDTLQQCLDAHNTPLILTTNGKLWKLTLKSSLIMEPEISIASLNKLLEYELVTQLETQLHQFKELLSNYRMRIQQSQRSLSAIGSEIIRSGVEILDTLYGFFAASKQVNSPEHHVLVFALFDLMQEVLLNPINQGDQRSIDLMRQRLESLWVGCCCEVIVFNALKEILQTNFGTGAVWGIEFADQETDRSDATDIVLTIDSQIFHIQVKARSKHVGVTGVEVYDSKQLLRSAQDLQRLNIDVEAIERIQIGLFQLNARGIVIVVNENLLNLETASPTTELVAFLERALRTVGVLPQAYPDIV